ncbi:MAG: PHP domain-containing protein [Anaerolineae bacterium]
MHSTASDGVYSPPEVVGLAIKHQMDVIALTDHDNVDGIAPAQLAAANTSLRVLAGVELSSEDDAADRHVLGYLVDTTYVPLLDKLRQLQNARIERVQQIAAKLAAINRPISVERVLELAGEGSVGRPHIARAMVEAGHVNSIQDAFNRYIGDDGAAYVPHSRLTPSEAIQMIHAAGGVAVLAHPGHYGDYRAIIEALIPLGLDGVEVFYYDHSSTVITELQSIARHHDLLMTVGSDFHRREPDGSARIGSVHVPAKLPIVEAMEVRAARYR